jgi:hypothetical protein
VTDRGAGSDAALEAAVRELAGRLSEPVVPGLPQAVTARLEAAPAPERRFRLALRLGLQPVPTLRRVLVLVAALLVLLAATAAAAGFAVRGVRIVFSSTRPSVAPAARPAPFGAALNLGDRVTIERARSSVRFPVRVPTLPGLGEPDAVYLNFAIPGGQVSLVYRPRPGLPAVQTLPAVPTLSTPAAPGAGLLITQFEGGIERQLLTKVVGPDTKVDGVTVNGGRGFFIHGAPHEVFYVSPAGEAIADTIRLAGNVLVWQSGAVTIRLEGDFTREQALAIARSMR